ncbi:hypothetical protein ACJIZ3_017709 [Penstemon smallii]|uniref:Uncharacterized protein n=1 Tax=Penstemon smallii TaxID=265156 RepID=A0ABD3SXL5_9LAMI
MRPSKAAIKLNESSEKIQVYNSIGKIHFVQ